VTTTELTYHITNTCTCTKWDEATDEYTDEPSDECYGCWDDYVADFEHAVAHLMDGNESGWWRVRGLRLWDGDHGGYFYATKTDDLIAGMTVRGAWTMRYTVVNDAVHYSLSHHDAMGSQTTLTPVSSDDAEALGLD
jgi:hypothetical protein